MKKLIYSLSIFTIVLLFCNIILLHKYQKAKSHYVSLEDVYTKSLRKIKNDSLIAYESRVMQSNCELMFCPNITLINPKNKQNIRILDLIDNDVPLLFFRFKETDCDACIQHILGVLNSVTDKIPGFRVIILSGYKNVRQFYAYANSENKAFDVYNVDELPIILDHHDKPYFFLLDKDMIFKDVFFYAKEDKRLIDNYLEFIVQKYNKK